jgi:TonB-linked SusC/RagA family outer membrane protein
MRKLVLLLLCIALGAGQIWAQTRPVTGKVTDENNNPIAGASVFVKGTKQGVVTKSDGTFVINVSATVKTLTISFVGHETMDVEITATPIAVKLKQTTGPMDEIVVIGYTVVKRKRDEAGAISTIRAKEIENIPNASLDKALQGRAAGVTVQANNGIPGGAINVRIRGNGSIQAGNAPLYIVDGVQINTTDNASFQSTNPLAFLNPDDIESIDILKDAASGAIYGSNAANGVILITTKKGKAGKTRVNFNYYTGIVMPIQYLNVLNSQELFQVRLEATNNAANATRSPSAQQPLRNLTDMRTVLNDFRVPIANITTLAAADSAVAALKTYDWQRALFGNNSVQNYEVNVSGGTDKNTFRISASYQKQGTIVTKADFTRGSLKIDFTNKITDKLTASTSTTISTVTQSNPFTTSGSALGSGPFAGSGIWPTNPIYNQDGSYYGVMGFTPSNLAGTLSQNSVQVTDYDNGFTRTNMIVGNIRLDYKINSWLTLSGQANMDYRNLYSRQVWDARTADAYNRKGLTQIQSVWNTNKSAFTTLNFNKTFADKHRVDGLVGYEYRSDYQYQSFESGDGFPIYLLTYLQNAGNIVSFTENNTGYKRNGVFGALNYTFNRKYTIGFTARRDGSSRFGANHKYGIFPGGKFAWNVDQENFMKNIRVISSLKFRVSYGSTGNDQIGNFDGLNLFGTGGVYNGAAGLNYTQLGYPDLKWETNTTLNWGLDFGLAKNRVTASIELYNKKNTDLLIQQPLPNYTGFTSISTNVGAMSNKGVEITLDADIIKSKKADGFGWSTHFVFAYNKNKVTKLYKDINGNDLKVLPGNPGITVGYPRNVLFTQRYAGVNPATGRPMWYDTLGNLTYLVQARDRVYIGPTDLPEYTGGWGNTFRYKNFTLDLFFQYQYGLLTTDGQVNFLMENLSRINALKVVYQNRWTTPGQITWYPRFASTTSSAESKGSGAQSGDRMYFKADYIRLKTFTLSYDLSNATTFLKKLNLSSAKFYIQGTNLWTKSAWYSYDIEFVGTATGIVPQSKNITVGIQLGL